MIEKPTISTEEIDELLRVTYYSEAQKPLVKETFLRQEAIDALLYKEGQTKDGYAKDFVAHYNAGKQHYAAMEHAALVERIVLLEEICCTAGDNCRRALNRARKLEAMMGLMEKLLRAKLGDAIGASRAATEEDTKTN
jgi:hypothetical protein